MASTEIQKPDLNVDLKDMLRSAQLQRDAALNALNQQDAICFALQRKVAEAQVEIARLREELERGRDRTAKNGKAVTEAADARH